MKNIPVITIDGPSGTGKGSLCQMLAEKLGWHLLDSGALYRVLALAADWHAVDIADLAGLERLAEGLEVSFEPGAKAQPPRVFLEGKEVSSEVRSEACGNAASKIAVIPEVRRGLLARQHDFRQAPGLVTDGRDMGTVVFPDAELKLYLVASAEIRAQRRYDQLLARGISVKLDQIVKEINERDKRDSSRDVAPLKPAADAVVLDTTELSIDVVLEQVLLEVEKRLS